MTTTSRMETSVMSSLAELAGLERARVAEEGARSLAAREEAGRLEQERRSAAAKAQQEHAAAAERAKREEERAHAEGRARSEARERAAADVVRTTAAAKVQMDADNAVRAHELALLQSRSEARSGRLIVLLAASLAVAVLAGVGVALERRRDVARFEREASQLRDQERVHGAEAALAKADAASALISAVTRAAAQRGAALDRRHADLVAWAAATRRSDLPAVRDAANAAALARGQTEGALDTYEGALDRLRDGLAVAAPVVAVHRPHGSIPAPPRSCRDDDPICGMAQGRL